MSRAMRNRGVEVFLESPQESHKEVMATSPAEPTTRDASLAAAALGRLPAPLSATRLDRDVGADDLDGVLAAAGVPAGARARRHGRRAQNRRRPDGGDRRGFPGGEGKGFEGFRVAGGGARGRRAQNPARRRAVWPRWAPSSWRAASARAPRSPPRGSTCTRAGKPPRRPDASSRSRSSAASRRFCEPSPTRRPEDATRHSGRTRLERGGGCSRPCSWSPRAGPRPRTRRAPSRTPPGASSRGRRARARWWKPPRRRRGRRARIDSTLRPGGQRRRDARPSPRRWRRSRGGRDGRGRRRSLGRRRRRGRERARPAAAAASPRRRRSGGDGRVPRRAQAPRGFGRRRRRRRCGRRRVVVGTRRGGRDDRGAHPQPSRGGARARRRRRPRRARGASPRRAGGRRRVAPSPEPPIYRRSRDPLLVRTRRARHRRRRARRAPGRGIRRGIRRGTREPERRRRRRSRSI